MDGYPPSMGNSQVTNDTTHRPIPIITGPFIFNGKDPWKNRCLDEKPCVPYTHLALLRNAKRPFSDAIARPGKALNIHQWWCQWHPADSDPRLEWMCALGEMVLLRKVIYSISEQKSVCIHKYFILYTLIYDNKIYLFLKIIKYKINKTYSI